MTGVEISRKAPMPLVDRRIPERIETATFALGWFWGPDSQFGSLPGVVRTRVGYAGGTTPHPMYRNLGDHTEAIQIDYDPERISYKELLNVFWESHNPFQRSWSNQYKAAVFVHNEDQKRHALALRDRQASRGDQSIYTEVLPLTHFTPAEDYHQKYRLRNESSLMREFKDMYPNAVDFMNSTAAARVNGYLGGYGTPEAFMKELDALGLSKQGKETLLDILSSSRPAFKNCRLR